MVARLDAQTLAKIITPALLIDLDAVRANLSKLIAHVSGDTNRLRPHVKTSKLRRTFDELVDAGLKNFKCATTREAEHLLDALRAKGVAGDVLVAYPHHGASLARLAVLAAEHPSVRLSILSEDPDHIGLVPKAIGIFIDINVGMNRTGIPTADIERVAATMRAAGDRLRGLHAYEGHVHGGSLDERRERCRAAYEPLLALIDHLGDQTVTELVTSGTPSFIPALEYEPFRRGSFVHRVSPGTVVYDDLRTDECTELDFAPAAFVLARVVSHPAPGLVTLDAGSKALAAEAGDPCAAVVEYPSLEAQTPSEEHLPCIVRGDVTPRRGEVVHLVPRHVCPTVNLAEHALIVEGGVLISTAPVSSRAHDLTWPSPLT